MLIHIGGPGHAVVGAMEDWTLADPVEEAMWDGADELADLTAGR